MDTNIKRKVIQFGAPPGVISILLVWGIEFWLDKDISFLDRFALPGLAAIFGMISFLFWRQKISERMFDFWAYSSFIVYAVAKFENSLSIAYRTNSYFTTNFLLWLPFFYIIGFLLLETRDALVGSSVSYLIMLGVGIYYVIQSSRTGIIIGNLSFLFQVYIACALYIVVAYLLSRLWARYYAASAIAETMSKLAITDPLTGICNRRSLDDAIREGLYQFDVTGKPFSIILFDLDHFKLVNDIQGHATGDIILKQVAQRIQENIRKSDLFGRWGGDEFLYVAFDTDVKGAVELAERLRTVLANAQLDNMITASFGIAVSQNNDHPERMVRHADEALYQAKAKGKNRIEVFCETK
jgi:diguanylate cyclase (GGDEF)-like protein